MSLLVSLTDNGFYFSKDGCHKPPKYVSYSDEDAVSGFFQALGRGSLIRVLIDVIEEEIEFVELPKVYPWERKKVLSVNQKRVKGSRVQFLNHKFVEGDKGLYIRFFKIFKNSGIESFFTQCEQNNILIEGIYVPEILFEESINKLRLDKKVKKILREKIALVVSKRTPYSYKQSVFNKGVLELVRTIEIPDDIDTTVSAYDYIARECDMTIKYLYNTGVLEYGKPIDLIFIDGDEIKENRDGLAALIESSLVVQSDWEDQEYSSYFFTFSELLNQKNLVSDFISFSFCLLEKQLFPKSHIVTEVTSLVSSSLVIRRLFFLSALIFLMIGGYYIGSLASQLIFLKDSSDYISAQNKNLTLVKKDLENRIQIPYDARDLRFIVEFSEAYPKEHERSSIRRVVLSLANLLDQNPSIKLVKVSVERSKRSDQILSPIFHVKAKFVLTDADVLYSKNIERIQAFYHKLSELEAFQKVTLTKLPIEIEPNRAQVLNERMLMPVSLPFDMEFEWHGE